MLVHNRVKILLMLGQGQLLKVLMVRLAMTLLGEFFMGQTLKLRVGHTIQEHQI